MIENWIESLNKLILGWGLNENYVDYLEGSIILLVIFGLALLSDYLTKRILITSIKTYVKRSKNTWDDVFLEKKVFHKLAHIAPALVVFYTIDFAIDPAGIVDLIKKITIIYMIIISVLTVTSFTSSLHEIYRPSQFPMKNLSKAMFN